MTRMHTIKRIATGTSYYGANAFHNMNVMLHHPLTSINTILDSGRRMVVYDVFKGNFSLAQLASSSLKMVGNLPGMIKTVSWCANVGNGFSNGLGFGPLVSILPQSARISSEAEMVKYANSSQPVANPPDSFLSALFPWNSISLMIVLKQYAQSLTFNPWITGLATLALLGIPPETNAHIAKATLAFQIMQTLSIPGASFLPFAFIAILTYELVLTKNFKNGMFDKIDSGLAKVASMVSPQMGPMALPLIKSKITGRFRPDQGPGRAIKLDEQCHTLYFNQPSQRLQAIIERNRAILLGGNSGSVKQLTDFSGLSPTTSYDEAIGAFREDSTVKAVARSTDVFKPDDERLAHINPDDTNVARSQTGGTMMLTSKTATVYNADEIDDKIQREGINCQTALETLIIWLGAKSSDSQMNRLERTQLQRKTNDKVTLKYTGSLATCRLLNRFIEAVYGSKANACFTFIDDKTNQPISKDALNNLDGVPKHMVRVMNNMLSSKLAEDLKQRYEQHQAKRINGLRTTGSLLWRPVKALFDERYDVDSSNTDYLRCTAAPAA